MTSDPGEVTLKADIMKLVSDKSKVYPELFDPDLSSAYDFSPGEGALNQFRTLKNSGDAEVLAVWKEIAPPGTQRVHFSGCQWSEYYQYDRAGNRVSIQNGWGMIESRCVRENQLIQRSQMRGVQMSRRGTVGLAGFESGSNAPSYTYDALGRRWKSETGVADVRSYNPPGKEIWWNQTNEALNKKIPKSITTGTNTSGTPSVGPEKITTFLSSLLGIGSGGGDGSGLGIGDGSGKTDESKNN